jgi:hypothetical protein
VDGALVAERAAGRGRGPARGSAVLAAGAHVLEMALDPAASRLRVWHAAPGKRLAPFARGDLWRGAPSAVDRACAAAAWPLSAAALGAWALALAVWGARGRGARWRAARALDALRSPWLPRTLAVLVVAYAALLRADALVSRFGPRDAPDWVGRLQAAARAAHPAALRWDRVPVPYVDGDPIAYLGHARRMRSFYEPRYREPLFVAAARAGVWATGGRDVGISVASATFSVLLVAATYALGAGAVSPWVGVLAALGLALDAQAIHHGVAGWRDDAFAVLVAAFALFAVRLYDRGRFADAVALGLAGGLACLTRITALSLLPVAVLLALVPRARAARVRRERAAAAAVLTLALAAPWLAGSWIAYGDPLQSVSGQVGYYTDTSAPRTGVVGYVGERLGRPFEALDVALVGFTGYPFTNKWDHDVWWRPLGGILAACAVGGLVLFLLDGRTRVLLAVLASALLPFVLTWHIRMGDSWRLTLFAYPFYLVAAFAALRAGLRLLVAPEARADLRRVGHRRFREAAGILAVALLLAPLAWLLPWLRAGEDVRHGTTARLEAGPRDRVFFADGWYPPVCTELLCLRYARGTHARLRVPLRAGRDYVVRLRLDPFPFAGMRPQHVVVSGNGRPLGRLALAYDPVRTGTYELRWPAAATEDGANALELAASYATTVGTVDADDAIAEDGWTTAFVLWYVAVEPFPATARAGDRGSARRGPPAS